MLAFSDCLWWGNLMFISCDLFEKSWFPYAFALWNGFWGGFQYQFGLEHKFWKAGFSISGLEPKFGNPSFDTTEKQNIFNFQLTCFSAIFDFILCLCKYQPQLWNLEFTTYFSVIVVWCWAAKESSQTQLFKTGVTHISGMSKLGFPNSGSKRILKTRNWRSSISGLLQ